MKVSVLALVHDKPPEVWGATLDGISALGAEQIVIVHDRSPRAILERSATVPGATIINLEGRPGWRSPCVAANAGLAAVTGEVMIYNPSDVIPAPGNLDILRAHFAEQPASVLFGRVVESEPEKCKRQGDAGPVLQGSDCTRPMTFLTAYPTATLKALNGWDEVFMEGVCYEDDDLAARLWKAGLDFVFDDRFHGVHQTHERLFDGNNASQGYWTDYRVGINRGHMVNRHGRESAINVVMQSKPTILTEPGRVTWKHA